MKGVAMSSIAFYKIVSVTSISEMGALAYERDDGEGKSARLAPSF